MIDHIPAAPPKARNGNGHGQKADLATARFQQKGSATVDGQGVLTEAEAEAGNAVPTKARGGEVGEKDEVGHIAVPHAARHEVEALTDRDEVDPGDRDLNPDQGDHLGRDRETTRVVDNKKKETHHGVGRTLILRTLISLPPFKTR